MSDTSNNVIPFERPTPERELTSCELRLDDGFGIELRVYNEYGAVVAVLDYKLASSPPDFDLCRLAEAWTRWREASSIAS